MTKFEDGDDDEALKSADKDNAIRTEEKLIDIDDNKPTITSKTWVRPS